MVAPLLASCYVSLYVTSYMKKWLMCIYFSTYPLMDNNVFMYWAETIPVAVTHLYICKISRIKAPVLPNKQSKDDFLKVL